MAKADCRSHLIASIGAHRPGELTRFSTLARLCAALQCQPGDLLRYCPGPEDEEGEGDG